LATDGTLVCGLDEDDGNEIVGHGGVIAILKRSNALGTRDAVPFRPLNVMWIGTGRLTLVLVVAGEDGKGFEAPLGR
jgi:hypothetical protein